MARKLDDVGQRMSTMNISLPDLVFYIERDDLIDVWRILHDMRDIPTWLREDSTKK